MQYQWLILMLGYLCFCPQAHADTLHVYFPHDVAFLDKTLEKQIDKIIPVIKTEKNILVIGYADKTGDTYYNDMLSMRRAQNVANYLSANGLSESTIKLVYGRGEIERNDKEQDKFHYDRRVDIVSYNNQPVPPAPKPKPTPKPKPVVSPIVKPESLTNQLDSLSVGETMRLDNIQFVPGQAIPLTSSRPQFDELYEALKENPDLKISIEGHICCENEPEGDTTRGGYRLSVNRAKVVYMHLRKKGIETDRMSFKGFSSWHRLRPEVDEVSRALNRRVEIRVLSK